LPSYFQFLICLHDRNFDFEHAFRFWQHEHLSILPGHLSFQFRVACLGFRVCGRFLAFDSWRSFAIDLKTSIERRCVCALAGSRASASGVTAFAEDFFDGRLDLAVHNPVALHDCHIGHHFDAELCHCHLREHS
jgi:hypothetical protein